MKDNAYVEVIAGHWAYRAPHDPVPEERTRFPYEGVDSAFSEVKRIVDKGVAAWRRRRALNQTVTALSELGEHRLRDIGMHRTQIPHAARFIVDNPDVDPRPYFG